MTLRMYRKTRRISGRYPWLLSLVIPWTLILIVFHPVIRGLTPVNLDWLVTEHYPWKAFTDAGIHNPDIDDPALEFYPLARRAADIIRNGRIPLWNPSIGCGIPQLADFISQPLDPLFLLVVLTISDFAIAWAILLLLQLMALSAAVSGFLLARRSTVIGASVGASAVVFCAPVISWMELRGLNASILCLFLALWAIESGRRKRRIPLVTTAVAMAYGGLAGHPQFTFHVWCLSAVFFMYRLKKLRRPGRLAVNLLAVLALAATLCAPAVLPQLELLQEATRGQSGRYFSMFRFGAAQWLSLLLPDILGHPARQNYFGTYIYFRSYTTLPILYFGALPLTAVLLALRSRSSTKRFFVGISVVILTVLTLAALKPARLFLQSNMPDLFDTDPARIAVLASILLAAWSGEAFSRVSRYDRDSAGKSSLRLLLPAVLIISGTILFSMSLMQYRNFFNGLAADNSFLLYLLKLQDEHGSLINTPGIRRMTVFFMIAGLVLCLFRCNLRWKFLPAAATALVLALDLAPWAIRFNPFVSQDLISLPGALAGEMENHRDPMFRSTALESADASRAEASVFPPNSLPMFHVPDFRMYSSTPLRRYNSLVQHVQPRTYWDRSIREPVVPLLGLAAVKWIYCAPDHFPARTDIRMLEQLPGLNVYYCEDVVPRIRLTGFHPADHDLGEGSDTGGINRVVWDWLHENPERFIRQTIVQGDPEDTAWKSVPADATGAVLNVEWSDCRILATVESETPATLVLSDSWYPGWTASVNGHPTCIGRANGLFRAVAVPEGRSVIDMRYQPVSYRLGLFLALTALMAVSIAWKFSLCQEKSDE